MKLCCTGVYRGDGFRLSLSMIENNKNNFAKSRFRRKPVNTHMLLMFPKDRVLDFATGMQDTEPDIARALKNLCDLGYTICDPSRLSKESSSLQSLTPTQILFFLPLLKLSERKGNNVENDNVLLNSHYDKKTSFFSSKGAEEKERNVIWFLLTGHCWAIDSYSNIRDVLKQFNFRGNSFTLLDLRNILEARYGQQKPEFFARFGIRIGREGTCIGLNSHIRKLESIILGACNSLVGSIDLDTLNDFFLFDRRFCRVIQRNYKILALKSILSSHWTSQVAKLLHNFDEDEIVKFANEADIVDDIRGKDVTTARETCREVYTILRGAVEDHQELKQYPLGSILGLESFLLPNIVDGNIIHQYTATTTMNSVLLRVKISTLEELQTLDSVRFGNFMINICRKDISLDSLSWNEENLKPYKKFLDKNKAFQNIGCVFAFYKSIRRFEIMWLKIDQKFLKFYEYMEAKRNYSFEVQLEENKFENSENIEGTKSNLKKANHDIEFDNVMKSSIEALVEDSVTMREVGRRIMDLYVVGSSDYKRLIRLPSSKFNFLLFCINYI